MPYLTSGGEGYEFYQKNSTENKRGFRNAWGLFNRDKKPADLEIPGALVIRDLNFNKTYDWEKWVSKDQPDLISKHYNEYNPEEEFEFVEK